VKYGNVEGRKSLRNGIELAKSSPHPSNHLNITEEFLGTKCFRSPEKPKYFRG
jgi:hypothetical protein